MPCTSWAWVLVHGIAPTYRETVIKVKHLELKSLYLWLYRALHGDKRL